MLSEKLSASIFKFMCPSIRRVIQEVLNLHLYSCGKLSEILNIKKQLMASFYYRIYAPVSKKFPKDLIPKPEKQCTYNVILRRVHKIIVAVENQ